MPRRKRGRRGGGSIYYDSVNGCWMAAISLRGKDGKRIQRKARARDAEDAKVQLDRLLRAHRAGVDPAKGTLDRYFREWLKDVRSTVRESTWMTYESHFRLHISPLLGGISLVRLRPSDVRRLKSELLTTGRVRESGTPGLSPATVGHVLTTLRIALNQAVRDRLLPDNPADAVPLPRVEREAVTALTEQGAADIIEATKDSHIANLVVLLLGSGLRVGEALGLDWRDVDLETGFVIVRRSKTRVRAVPISDDAVAALQAQMAATPRYGPSEPVFLGERKSQRLRRDSVLHLFQPRLEDAGLPRMTIHELRHGVATLLVSQGVHMRVIAQQLGHANPSMTANTYAHVVPESQREAVGLLNRRKMG